MTGRLTGIGVGPGDPELITRRGLRLLQQADRVVAPTTAPDAVGRAEAIVRQAAPEVAVERLPIEMGPDPSASYDSAARLLVGYLDAGEHVCFVTLGDPNVYSTFSSLSEAVRRIRAEAAVDTVPGIMAFQELAARTGSALVEGTGRMALVTALGGTSDLASALRDEEAAVVVYKGGRYLEEVSALLAKAERADDAVVGELLGLPGERISPLREVADRPASYLVTVISPPRRRTEGHPG